MAGGFLADPASLTEAAATLHDLAHDLQAGQFDLFLVDWAGDPASHPDVARATRMFGGFAQNAADGYQQIDDAAALERDASGEARADGRQVG